MAASATVRVEPEVRDRINQLAAARGVKAAQLVGQLVRAAEEAELLADMNADFEALNEDPTARAAYDEELRDWDAILLDGLGDES
jgi:predicted transcriptional regulator